MPTSPTYPDPPSAGVSALHAWIGRKETKLRRTKLDCGCPNLGEVFFHLWCDRLACEKHADSPHICGEFKGKSSSEEESAPVEAEVASPSDVLHYETPIGTWEISVAENPVRSGITLAKMNAASAAVRARLAAPPVDAALEPSPTGGEVADFVEEVLGVEVEPWQRQMLNQPADRSWLRRMLGGGTR